MNWHSETITNIKEKLESDIHKGLSKKEAEIRLNKFGLNTFTEEDGVSLLNTIVSQIKSPLVIVLIIAGIATFFLKEYLDTIVIFIALFINIIIGTIQEKRAGSAFAKLKESQEKFASVFRDGERMLIPAENVVVGDIIIVEAGSYVPADARIIDSSSFTVNESMLTGEWIEISKNNKNLDEKTGLTNRFNMIWMGTLVTGGMAKAIVVATGNNTQVGMIAKDLVIKESATPLQKSMQRLAISLTGVIFIALFLILLIGILKGEAFNDMLLVAIAIAVAAMPEGLPAAVTVVLAIGMESILKKKGLVRNLLAAETLGSTTVILTDKTGTLTKAKMRVSSIFTYATIVNKEQNKPSDNAIIQNTDERDILIMGMFTSNAFVEGYDDALSEWTVRGLPVEKAILLAGIESGIKPDRLSMAYPEHDSIPFESEKRFSASIRYLANLKKNRIYFTGAPEVLLANTKHVYKNGEKVKITNKIIEQLEKIQDEKTSQGMRLIAVAYKDTNLQKFTQDVRNEPSVLFEGGIVFGGFIVIHDPLRPDVAKSIKEARDAGAQVIMLTGDNKNTARRIAIEAGISSVSGKALSGSDIENYSDTELHTALKNVRIFARVLPHQKMRIVRILKDNGEVVAMTGDGINDAPALRRADIGIALGSGTEVAKEASDMILLNNSFTVIVDAIKEGRRILDNLKKIVAYLLSTSFSEIFVVGGAIIMGAPLPLLPAQILWTNIVGEGFMNFAFAFEPQQSDIMKRNPSSIKMKRILTKHLQSLILIIGLVTGIFLIALYFILLLIDLPIEQIRTIMFMVLSSGSIFFSLSLKDLSKPIWKINIFSNKYFIFAILASIGTLLLAIFTPILQKLLSLEPVSLFDLFFVLIAGIFNLMLIEITKHIYFSRKKS